VAALLAMVDVAAKKKRHSRVGRQHTVRWAGTFDQHNHKIKLVKGKSLGRIGPWSHRRGGRTARHS
jgi:hypothetical protein